MKFHEEYYIRAPRHPGTSPPYPSIASNQTKVEDGYILEVIATSPNLYKPSEFDWWVINESGYRIAENNFPTKSGLTGSTINNNITISWFDNDRNGVLSCNDEIKIQYNKMSLIDYEFVIIYRRYNFMADSIRLK